MKRKLPTILVLLVMALIGAMYWVDVTYYTDPVSGFLNRGELWMRYAVLVLPLVMSLLGLRTVGPRAVGTMRTVHRGLAVLFCVAAASGAALGVSEIAFGVSPLSVFRLILGALFLWYAVWMLLAALQLFGQKTPSPTKSAYFGILAALPYCMLTVYRILAKPTSLYRMGPLVRCYAALFAMLWFSMLLRSLYVALPRRWVRWMYILGLFTFLFATCLELPQALWDTFYRGQAGIDLMESLNMSILGLLAGCVSVALAGQPEVVLQPKPNPLDG